MSFSNSSNLVIVYQSCPSTCTNITGTCVKGICECKDNYHGSDCSSSNSSSSLIVQIIMYGLYFLVFVVFVVFITKCYMEGYFKRCYCCKKNIISENENQTSAANIQAQQRLDILMSARLQNSQFRQKIARSLLDQFMPPETGLDLRQNYFWQDSSLVYDCIICLQKILDDDLCRITYCFHPMHQLCFDQWLKKHDSCPYCRQKLDMTYLLTQYGDFIQEKKQKQLQKLQGDLLKFIPPQKFQSNMEAYLNSVSKVMFSIQDYEEKHEEFNDEESDGGNNLSQVDIKNYSNLKVENHAEIFNQEDNYQSAFNGGFRLEAIESVYQSEGVFQAYEDYSSNKIDTEQIIWEQKELPFSYSINKVEVSKPTRIVSEQKIVIKNMGKTIELLPIQKDQQLISIEQSQKSEYVKFFNEEEKEKKNKNQLLLIQNIQGIMEEGNQSEIHNGGDIYLTKTNISPQLYPITNQGKQLSLPQQSENLHKFHKSMQQKQEIESEIQLELDISQKVSQKGMFKIKSIYKSTKKKKK